MKRQEKRKFYGSVTVSERGQVVIPVEARRDFQIKEGDKLLVFGDLEQGLGIVTFSIMQKTMEGTAGLFREIGWKMKGRGATEGRKPAGRPKKVEGPKRREVAEEKRGKKPPEIRTKPLETNPGSAEISPGSRQTR